MKIIKLHNGIMCSKLYLRKMVYKVIGIMSGSSLDGLDFCYTFLDENRGKWSFDIQEAECLPYSEDLRKRLQTISNLGAGDFLKLHTSFGRHIGEQLQLFIEKYGLAHKVDFVATHGHTVYHNPAAHTSFQIGDGATIAAITGLPVISDLRSLDVALGGQGAPIVPIGDKLLFGDFDYWLNIGGIVNITVRDGDKLTAFDVCTGNQALNSLSMREGLDYDDNGNIARRGKVLFDVLGDLNDQDYFKQMPPKSLSNERANELVFPVLMESPHITADLLKTMVQHIADQIVNVVKQFPHGGEYAKMLVTGGGAFNNFLVETLKEGLEQHNVNAVLPYEQVIKYKEALVMALIGALRWREETNVMSDVTGASKDSISGALWMGHSYN